MEKKYTSKEVLAILEKTFPESEVDFQPEFLDNAEFTQKQLDKIIENFPAIERNLQKKYTYNGYSL